jgi:ParB family chromosome partitioning protein
MANNPLQDNTLFLQELTSLRKKAPRTQTDPDHNLQALAVEIPLECIDPDPEQPRRLFEPKALQELAESISQHGLLQPLVVRPRQGPHSQGRYWIVAGERRYRAAKSLGFHTLPCMIRPYTNMQALVISLAENLHREDLDAVEKSEALHRLRTITEKSWEEIADLVKLSESHVKTLSRIKNLDDSVKQLVRERRLSDRKAIALLPLQKFQQREMATQALAEELTAEQIREKVQLLSPRPSITRTTPPVLPDFPDLPAERLLAGCKGGETRPEPPLPTGQGPVAAIMRGFILTLRKIDGWLQARNWAPSQVSTAQREVVEELYHVTSALQQHLIHIRNGWRFQEEGGGERAKRSPFPF